MTNRHRAGLAAVLLVALALRIWWSVVAARDPQGLHDPLFYMISAEQVADGECCWIADGPTAYYPVGYPAVLGSLFRLADHTPLPDGRPGLVAGLNVVLGVVTVALVFEIARRLFGPGVGLGAAAATAVFPNLVYNTAVPLTETFFLVVFLGALLVLVWRPWSGSDPPAWRWAVFGALMGAAALIRPVVLVLLPLLPLVWWRSSASVGWLAGLRRLALVGAACAAAIAPWTIRNAATMGAFVPISTNTGDNLCIGRYPGATGGFAITPYCATDDSLRRPEYEVHRNRENTRQALEYFRRDPLAELPLVVKRAAHTLDGDHDGVDAAESYGDDPFLSTGTRRALSILGDVWFYATAALTLVAVALVRTRDVRARLLVVAGAAVLLPPLLTFGDSRFKVPLLPLLAVGAAALLHRRGRRSSVTGV